MKIIMLQIFNILNRFYDDNASHLKLRTKLKNAWFLSNCDTVLSSNVISMVDEIYIGYHENYAKFYNLNRTTEVTKFYR